MSLIANKEGITYDTCVSMETIICYNCAIPFAVPSDYKSNLKKTQDNFFCPNGHQQHYAKSTETILREKMAKIEAEKEREIRVLKDQVMYKERTIKEKSSQIKVIRAKHTRMKNRIANGVCPCCNRSFQNLHNHIKNQHPDFNHNQIK